MTASVSFGGQVKPTYVISTASRVKRIHLENDTPLAEGLSQRPLEENFKVLNVMSRLQRVWLDIVQHIANSHDDLVFSVLFLGVSKKQQQHCVFTGFGTLRYASVVG